MLIIITLITIILNNIANIPENNNIIDINNNHEDNNINNIDDNSEDNNIIDE